MSQITQLNFGFPIKFQIKQFDHKETSFSLWSSLKT